MCVIYICEVKEEDDCSKVLRKDAFFIFMIIMFTWLTKEKKISSKLLFSALFPDL